MLGRGRPFSVEIINARKHTFTREEYNEMRDKINASTNLMKVHDLQGIERYVFNNVASCKLNSEQKGLQYYSARRRDEEETLQVQVFIITETWVINVFK